MRLFGGVCNTFIVIAVLVVSCLVVVANGWCPTTTTTTRAIGSASFRWSRTPSTMLSFSATTDDSSSSAGDVPQASVEDVLGMRLSEIKSELKERNIDFSDCFDKESMVLKLAEARANNIDNSSSNQQDKESESDDGEEESPPSPSSPNKAASDEAFDREKALEELKGMRVRELREELGRRRIPRAGLFEKEDLINALLEARAIASVYSGTGMMTPGEVSELSETDVQTEMDHPGTLLLLDVYATWCGPCQMIAPILKEIAAEEGAKLRVVKMDSDQNQVLASKLKVNGLPTLVLFKGGDEIDRLEGAPTKEQLMGWIDSRR
jgi:thioredoxin 1